MEGRGGGIVWFNCVVHRLKEFKPWAKQHLSVFLFFGCCWEKGFILENEDLKKKKKNPPRGYFFNEKSHEVLVKKLSYRAFGENYHEFCFGNFLKKIISHEFLFWKALKTLFGENPFGNKFWNQFVWQNYLKLIEKYNSTKSFWCKTMDLQC